MIIPRANSHGNVLGEVFDWLRRPRPCGHLEHFAALLAEVEDGHRGKPEVLAALDWLRDQLGLPLPERGGP